MKTTTLLIGCIVATSYCFTSVASSSAALDPTFEGTLHTSNNVFFIGKTNIRATCTGFPMSTILNSSLTAQMNAFILLGGDTLFTLSTVILAQDIDITKTNSLEELYLRYHDHLTRFTNVNIVTESGVFLLGYPTGGSIDLQSTASYAISSSGPLTLGKATFPCFFTATLTPLTLTFSGDFAVLAQSNSNTTVIVQNQQGKNLWSGHSTNDYLIIQDQHFQITQHAPLYVFPLNQKNTTLPSLSFSVTPATSDSIELERLFSHLSDQVERFNINISDVVDKNKTVHSFVSSAGLIANGAMILANTSDTVTIDDTTQSFKHFGFVRFHDLEVTLSHDNGASLRGSHSLVFLGDHFYNPQAKNNANGIFFPFGLLLVWIVAIVVSVYIRFMLRPAVNEQRDKTIRWYAFGIHFVLLIAAFLFLDWEINSQLGMSAFTSFASQGVSSTTGFFFGFELLIWAAGYAVLALPIRWFVNSVLRVFHIGKGGRGIGAGIGDFSIGIFTVLYLLLIMNVLITVFPLSNLFAGG